MLYFTHFNRRSRGWICSKFGTWFVSASNQLLQISGIGRSVDGCRFCRVKVHHWRYCTACNEMGLRSLV